MMEKQNVILGYWAMRGQAERIRHQLEYLKIPYTQEKFQGVQGRKKWFNEVKDQLNEKNAAVSLPYLVDKQDVITQADAIQIYLCYKAQRYQLLGRNFQQEIALSTAHGVFRDFYPLYTKLCYDTYNQKFTFEKQRQDSAQQFQEFIKKFNGLLGKKSFIAGEITWLDFALADFIQTLTILSKQYFKSYPKLIQYQKRVWGLPELKEYFASDRFHERPCNNFTAAWK